jgi:hypothetical protein
VNPRNTFVEPTILHSELLLLLMLLVVLPPPPGPAGLCLLLKNSIAKCVHEDDIGGCLKLLFSRDRKRKEGCKEVEKGGQEEEDECKSSAITMIMWTSLLGPPSEFCPSSYSAPVSAASPWPCHDSTPRLLHERKEQKQRFKLRFSLCLSLLCLFCDALLECNTNEAQKNQMKQALHQRSYKPPHQKN